MQSGIGSNVKKVLLSLSGLLVLGGNTSFAGGNHDGGDQFVKLRNGTMVQADLFPPHSGEDAFEPSGQKPIDLEKEFPGITVEVKTLSSLFDTYSDLRSYSTKDLVASNVFGLASQPEAAPKYYMVEKFPNVPDCRVPRDNSGVPTGASVFHIACTRGPVTLLLDSPRSKRAMGFRQLSREQMADVLVHEGFRREQVRIPTQGIETMVRGLALLRDLQKRQAKGERQPLSSVQVETITQFMNEVPLTGLHHGRVIGAVPPLERWRIWRNGGGLVSPALDAQADVFIGVGSNISIHEIESGVEILNSTIWSEYIGKSIIAKGTRISDSTLGGSVIQIDRDVTIASSSLVANAYGVKSRLKIEDGVIIKSTTIRAGVLLSLAKGVTVNEAEIFRLRDCCRHNKVVLEDGVTIDQSVVAHSTDFDSNRGDFIMGKKSQLVEKSNIFVSKNYYQGMNSLVSGLKLRVRPMELSDLKAKRTYADIIIKEDVQIKAKNLWPIVITFEGPSLLSFQAPKVEFTRSMILENKDRPACAIGLNPSTKMETSFVTTGLSIYGAEQFKALECRVVDREPLTERWCSRRFGDCYGYDLSNLFKATP